MQGSHTFHIPVMGTAFSIDTPLRVARYGISSVISLVDDRLIEQMRKFHCQREGLPFEDIQDGEEDARARRITAYLDIIDRIVTGQVKTLQASPFEEGSEITRYFELLPETPLRNLYLRMRALPEGSEKRRVQDQLRPLAVPGSIDVNIMTKLDRTVYRRGEPLPRGFSEAMSALRGYALSTLRSSIVFSAGINTHLYSYIGSFDDFLPDARNMLRKQIVLKVSDYRSAVVQGKFLAKRGLWVSEFRIESGLNCGGHAFATDGTLTGPILEEFKQNREHLLKSLHTLYCRALVNLGRAAGEKPHEMRVSVQGGIGDAGEQQLLLKHYCVNATGWGTPFLLCPDVTTVDDDHLQKLMRVKEGEVYLSNSSPLGLPFWNLRTSSSETARRRRIEEGKPGSKCPKGHLRINNEFADKPICTASRAYQKQKLRHLEKEHFTEAQLPVAKEWVREKSCICHDLAGCATLRHGIDPSATPAVCCGPNIINFRKIVSLEEMVSHIYGRLSLLSNPERPHMFIEELALYVKFLRREVENYSLELSARTPKYFHELKENLLKSIEYYRQLAGELTDEQRGRFRKELSTLQIELDAITLPAD